MFLPPLVPISLGRWHFGQDLIWPKRLFKGLVLKTDCAWCFKGKSNYVYTFISLHNLTCESQTSIPFTTTISKICNTLKTYSERGL